jgi:hypothetical protein
MSRVFLSALLLTAFSVPALADETVKAAEPTPVKLEAGTLPEADAAPLDPSRVEAVRIERAQRVALNAEMNLRIEKTKSDLKALEAEYLAATDHATKVAIQKQIGEVKKESRIDLLRIQMRHAEAAGRIGQVQEIAAAIQKITNPQIERVATPAARVQRTSTPRAGR